MKPCTRTSDAWRRTLLCSECDLRSRIATILRLDAMNYISPPDFVERNSYFFFDEAKPSSERGNIDSPPIKDLPRIIDHFTSIPHENWTEALLQHEIAGLHETLQCNYDSKSPEHNRNGLKTSRRQLQTILRSAVSLGRPGPSIGLTMAILGRSVTLRRLQKLAVILPAVEQDQRQGPRLSIDPLRFGIASLMAPRSLAANRCLQLFQ